MDQSRFDTIARAFAAPVTRRRGALMLVAGVLSLSGRIGAEPALAGANKAVGARCHRHEQCASALCAAGTGTCVAPCSSPGESCGDGGSCQPTGPGGGAIACVSAPADLNCAGFTPCTWNDRAKDPADMLSCPGQPGYVCIVTGFCSGPEEVCLPVTSPS